MKVLLLGGTAEARALALELVATGVDVESTLAGRVTHPRLPAGRVRVGGFGGPRGLAAYLIDQQVTHLVDATHPFATAMTRHAALAAAQTGIPAWRLARPGWSGRSDSDHWHWAADLPAAVTTAERLGRRPFVTTGRQTLPAYAAWSDRQVLVRVVEPPSDPLPERWRLVLDRGPYTLEGELELLTRHRIDVLTTKDSGGDHTSAKLDAAAALAIPVVVLARPSVPSGLPELGSVADVLTALGVPPRAP